MGSAEKVKGAVQWASHFLISFYLLTKSLLRKFFSRVFFYSPYEKLWLSLYLDLFFIFSTECTAWSTACQTDLFSLAQMDTWQITVSIMDIQWVPVLSRKKKTLRERKDWIHIQPSKLSLQFFTREKDVCKWHLNRWRFNAHLFYWTENSQSQCNCKLLTEFAVVLQIILL